MKKLLFFIVLLIGLTSCNTYHLENDFKAELMKQDTTIKGIQLRSFVKFGVERTELTKIQNTLLECEDSVTNIEDELKNLETTFYLFSDSITRKLKTSNIYERKKLSNIYRKREKEILVKANKIRMITSLIEKKVDSLNTVKKIVNGYTSEGYIKKYPDGFADVYNAEITTYKQEKEYQKYQISVSITDNTILKIVKIK